MKLEAWLEREKQLSPIGRLIRLVHQYCAMFGKPPAVLLVSTVYTRQFEYGDLDALTKEFPQLHLVAIYITRERRMHEPAIILSDELNTRQLII